MKKRREEKRREEKRREEKRREEKRREEKRREPDHSTHLNSKNTNTNFLEEFGHEIPKIPDHIMSKAMENGNILIRSFHDDDPYIQLSGDMATAWQRIDGKRNWEKILKMEHQYNTQEETQSIYEIISHILKNEDFKIIKMSSTGSVEGFTSYGC